MREVLFRGKDAITGKWLEGYFVQQKNNIGGIHSCIFQNFPDENKWEMKRVDLATVCQYTGLTDKNERKIFEGDIVRFDDCSNYPIFWDSDYCAFGSCWYSDFDHLSKYRNTKMEIVGNIFDDKELLEEDE